jgi:hypothetical protein
MQFLIRNTLRQGARSKAEAISFGVDVIEDIVRTRSANDLHS